MTVSRSFTRRLPTRPMVRTPCPNLRVFRHLARVFLTAWQPGRHLQQRPLSARIVRRDSARDEFFTVHRKRSAHGFLKRAQSIRPSMTMPTSINTCNAMPHGDVSW